MTAILGHCRHRYSSVSVCGLTVLSTAYGPGHASRPLAAHYPLIRSGESANAPELPPGSGASVAARAVADIPVSVIPPPGRQR